jgi:hypothetical protein
MRQLNPGIYNFLNQNGVANTPALTDLVIRNWGSVINNVYEHLDSYLGLIQQPNSPGPIEKHPYIDLYATDCDFQRHTILLGTFPPSSYLNNLPLNNLPNPNVQNNNPTHFFYGNMNSLWNYLFPGIQGNIAIPFLQQQLALHDISISDVFSFVQRKNMRSAADSDLKNIVVNCNLSRLFDSSSSIKTVLFTSGKLDSFLSNSVSTLTGFRWILEDCCGGLDAFTISGDISGNGPYYPINNTGLQMAVLQQEGGIVWWLKSENKTIRIINLPSPAGAAAIQMFNSSFFRKWINYKANLLGLPQLQMGQNVSQYLTINHHLIANGIPTTQYRQEVYQMVLNNTIHLI